MVSTTAAPRQGRADEDEADAADGQVAAEEHVQSGLRLRREQRDVEALAEFHEAYKLHATPRIRAQVGLAEQALGQWTAAESDLRAALGAADSWVNEHRPTIELALGYVETHLGWLLVETNVAGAEVSVDGAVVGRAPLERPARVAAGTAHVSLGADGYRRLDRSVNVEPGERTLVYVELVAAPPVPAPSPASAVVSTLPVQLAGGSPEPSRIPWAAIVLGGGAAVALGLGATYGVQTFTDKAARDQHCTGNACDRRGMALDDAARREALLSTVAFGAFAALAAASIWFFVQSHHAQRSGVHLVAAPRSAAASLHLVGEW
jgi:hypothetical protein